MSTGDEALPDRDALSFSKQEIAELDARFAELESGTIESISRTEAQRQLLEHLDRQIRVRQVIEQGLADSESNRVVGIEELRREFGLLG